MRTLYADPSKKNTIFTLFIYFLFKLLFSFTDVLPPAILAVESGGFYQDHSVEIISGSVSPSHPCVHKSSPTLVDLEWIRGFVDSVIIGGRSRNPRIHESTNPLKPPPVGYQIVSVCGIQGSILFKVDFLTNIIIILSVICI